MKRASFLLVAVVTLVVSLITNVLHVGTFAGRAFANNREDALFSSEEVDADILPDFSSIYCPDSLPGFSSVYDVQFRDTNVTLYTRDGSPVSAVIRSDSLEQDQITEMRNKVHNLFPSVTELDEPTYNYNCHSYAWHDQSTSNIYWIEYPTAYLNDSHTSQVTVPSAGSIVVYYNSNGDPCHSGVVYSVSGSTIYVTSKWGPYGLYRHLLGTVPDIYKNNGTISVLYFNYAHHSYGAYYYDASRHYRDCMTGGETQSNPHTYSFVGNDRVCRVCGYVDNFHPYDSFGGNDND